jgi:hypothetical protein
MYMLTYHDYVQCTDKKWRKIGFAENEQLYTFSDATTEAKRIKAKTGKNIIVDRATWLVINQSH